MCLRYWHSNRSDRSGWVSGDTLRVNERVFEAAIVLAMGGPGPYPADRIATLIQTVRALTNEDRWEPDGVTVEPWVVPDWEADAA